MEEKGPKLSLGGWRELAQIENKVGVTLQSGQSQEKARCEEGQHADLRSLLSPRAGSLAGVVDMGRDEAWSPVVKILKTGLWNSGLYSIGQSFPTCKYFSEYYLDRILIGIIALNGVWYQLQHGEGVSPNQQEILKQELGVLPFN